MIIEIRRMDHVQRVTYEDFEQRIRDGELRPDAMVRFEVVTGEDFRPLGELELYQALADPQRMAFRRNLTRAGVPIVTALLVGVQLRIYLASKTPGTSLWLLEHFTNWAPPILELGESWRLLSYGLLHVGFTHLLFNLCFLAYTGYHLERAMGRANLVLLYFGSVLSGGLLSMAFAPDRPSLGASGGAFGLLAAAVVMGWKHWDSIPARSRKYFGWALVPYLAVSGYTGLNSENVDNWSHFGGLLAGMALTTVLDPEVLPGRRMLNRRWRWLAGAAGVAMLALLSTRGLELVPLDEREDTGWTVSYPSYWRETWTFTGDRGFISPTLAATVSITTTVHPRPLDVEAASTALVQRVGTGSAEAIERSREAVQTAVGPGRRVEVDAVIDEERTRITALVVMRGVFEHRVLVRLSEETADRYAPLVERILSSVRFTDPEELVEAREKVSNHPRSWSPATELGEALYRLGKPSEALSAYERARTLAPDKTTPLIGQLRIYADYQVDGGPDLARAAISEHPLNPKVVVAASDVLYAFDETSDAQDVLDEAWAALPGDWELRVARLRRGLDVSLEEQPELPAP